MTSAQIKVVDGTLSRTAAGGVSGRIFLEVDGVQFPDEKWHDFVVVLLTTWCQTLFRFLNGDFEPIDIRFMEGPYLARLERVSAYAVNIELIETDQRRCLKLQERVKLRPLVESVVIASDQVLEWCKRNEWLSSDTERLISVLSDLRKAQVRSIN